MNRPDRYIKIFNFFQDQYNFLMKIPFKKIKIGTFAPKKTGEICNVSTFQI